MNLDKRLLRQAEAARFDLLLTVGLGLLAGVMLVLQALCLARIVSSVFLGRATLSGVMPLLVTLLGLALVRAGLSWGSEAAAHRAAGQVKSQLRERLSAHLLALGPAYARGERTGELTNTATEGIEALDAYVRQYLPQLALAALIPAAILVFVFPLDPLSGVILLITAPLIPFFMSLIGNLADALTRKQWTLLSRMSAHFLDVLQGLTTLKLLGRSRDQVDVIARTSDSFRRVTMGVLRVAFLSALVLEMLATISTAVVAVQIGLRLLYGYLDFEQAFFVLLLAPEFYLPLRMLGTRFHAGMSGVAAAQRIFEVLETPVKPAPQAREVDAALRAPLRRALQDGVVFTDVHYAYEDGRRPALAGFNLQLQPGLRTALVGPSGAGKSTVAHLLLRFLEPDQGSIAAGGIPLDQVPAAE